MKSHFAYVEKEVENMLSKYPEILTPEKVSEILQKRRKTVIKMMRNRELKCFRIGRSYRMIREDLENYIYRSRNENDTKTIDLKQQNGVDAAWKKPGSKRAKKGGTGRKNS
ncbi:MAG: helix-turn-helix domain-containing protein [Candidatus Omnitrophota bacterium]